VPKDIELILNGSIGAVSSCRSVSTNNQSLWARVANSPNIYYTNGNIGIGTNNPSSLFDVEGDSLLNGNLTITNGKNLKIDNVKDSTASIPLITYTSSNITLGSGITILSNGNVGISNTNPSVSLDVTGSLNVSNGANISGTNTTLNGATNFNGTTTISGGSLNTQVIRASGIIYSPGGFQYSDKSLKTNIEKLDDALFTMLKIEGVQFDWKNNNRHDVGFIAQDVQNQIPEIVDNDSKRDILTVSYVKMIPYLVEALKTQQELIDNQNKMIQRNQLKLKKLKSVMKKL
jgi:hypothetical protein